MTTTLITGANKGLGRETARRLVEAGHTVHIGARDPERGRRTAEELGAARRHRHHRRRLRRGRRQDDRGRGRP